MGNSKASKIKTGRESNKQGFAELKVSAKFSARGMSFFWHLIASTLSQVYLKLAKQTSA